MKRSLILPIGALALFGCQTNHNTEPAIPNQETPKQEKMIETAVENPGGGKPESWQIAILFTGLSALSQEERASNTVIVDLESRGSLESQCSGVRQAFGEKTYLGRPLTKSFLLFGDDDKFVLKVVDCALAGQHFDLSGYKVVYAGAKSSFDGIVDKLEPTGIVVVTKEYEGERK